MYEAAILKALDHAAVLIEGGEPVKAAIFAACDAFDVEYGDIEDYLNAEPDDVIDLY